MPNHWHLVLWPETDDAVERFVGWLSLTHVKRFHRWRGTRGPVYPERYEAVPVETGQSLFRVVRYVERNPCAAGLAPTPGAWQWSSAAAGSPIRLASGRRRGRPIGGTTSETAIETAELEDIRPSPQGEPLRRLRRRKIRRIRLVKTANSPGPRSEQFLLTHSGVVSLNHSGVV